MELQEFFLPGSLIIRYSSNEFNSILIFSILTAWSLVSDCTAIGDWKGLTPSKTLIVLECLLSTLIFSIKNELPGFFGYPEKIYNFFAKILPLNKTELTKISKIDPSVPREIGYLVLYLHT